MPLRYLKGAIKALMRMHTLTCTHIHTQSHIHTHSHTYNNIHTHIQDNNQSELLEKTKSVLYTGREPITWVSKACL